MDFINPKSMLTPGILAGLFLVISNAIHRYFGIPPYWTAIILSFLIMLPIVAKYTAPLWEKLIYYLINSLVVFATTVGFNYSFAPVELSLMAHQVGYAAEPSVKVQQGFDEQFEQSESVEEQKTPEHYERFFTDWFSISCY